MKDPFFCKKLLINIFRLIALVYKKKKKKGPDNSTRTYGLYVFRNPESDDLKIKKIKLKPKHRSVILDQQSLIYMFTNLDFKFIISDLKNTWK